MRQKSNRQANDPLETPSAPLPTFGTGKAAQILGISIRRLQGYVESPQYQLHPSEQLGTGRGSRRVFYEEDIYRLGIAEHLVRDGFSYKLVSKALQQMADDDLLGPFDSEGQEIDRVYVLVGGEENLQVQPVRRNRTIADLAKQFKSPSLYLLDIGKVKTEIQKRKKG
jgi:DNA-binding transcriptional MerR regulator